MKQEKPRRNIDKMGRLVIPNDLRRAVGLETGDEVSFEVSGTGILIIPVTGHCSFCGSKHDLVSFCDKYVCKSCIKELKMI